MRTGRAAPTPPCECVSARVCQGLRKGLRCGGRGVWTRAPAEVCIAARGSSRSVAPSSSRRCGALATRRGAARRDASTERGCGVRATASAATLAPVAGLIAAELACAAQSMLVGVAVVLLQSVGAEALPSSCELAAVLRAAALLGRMAAACRLRIAARLAAAEQSDDLAKLRAPSGILPTRPQRSSATARVASNSARCNPARYSPTAVASDARRVGARVFKTGLSLLLNRAGARPFHVSRTSYSFPFHRTVCKQVKMSGGLVQLNVRSGHQNVRIGHRVSDTSIGHLCPNAQSGIALIYAAEY